MQVNQVLEWCVPVRHETLRLAPASRSAEDAAEGDGGADVEGTGDNGVPPGTWWHIMKPGTETAERTMAWPLAGIALHPPHVGGMTVAEFLTSAQCGAMFETN